VIDRDLAFSRPQKYPGGRRLPAAGPQMLY